ncbi:MAG: MFS transporter [Chloroflexota bacterium]
MNPSVRRAWWRLTFFAVVMLVVEFMDEFAYSSLEAARPLIRDAFALSYVQVGLITTLPVLVAILVEPFIGLFADTGKRRLLIVGGGVAFGAGLVVQGLSPNFAVFLLGATLQAPASGVFVNLAQASLMDEAPTRRENRMAWWTLSGSLAVVVGPLTLTAMLALGSGWRALFIATGVLSVLAALWITWLPDNRAMRTSGDEAEAFSLRQSVREAGVLLRRGDVWRWLVLLQFSDLMLDMLFGLLALYMVDVVGVSQGQVGFAIATWTGVGLLGDFLLIPLLERVRGLVYLRFSAVMELLLYPAFLLVDTWWAKLVLLGLIGLFNAGWYAILQGKLYDALGEQSGAVLIVGNAAGVFGALLPLALGVVAQVYGLEVALWLLLAGPVALLIGLHRNLDDAESPLKT